MKKVIILLLILHALLTIQAQLSGDYTIGGSDPDYTTVNDAVNALASEGIDAPVQLLIRDGVYEEKLVIPFIPGSSVENWVTFESENLDENLVTLTYPGDDFEPNVFLSGAQYLRFSHLGFEFTGDVTYNSCIGNIGYDIIPISNIHITHCSFHSDNGLNLGIEFSGESGDLTIDYSTFTNLDEAIYIFSWTSNGQVTASDNVIDACGYGIEIEGKNDVIVSNNTITNCGDAGINVDNGLTVLIENNSIDGTVDEGIDLGDLTQSVSIIGNSLSNNMGAAISAYECGEMLIQDNVINNSFVGIESLCSSSISILNNQLTEIEDVGLDLEDIPGAIVCDNNLIHMNSLGSGLAECVSIQYLEQTTTISFQNNKLLAESERCGFHLEYGEFYDANAGVIANNMISGFKDALEIYIIYNTQIVHNSIYILTDEGGTPLHFGEIENVIFANNVIHMYDSPNLNHLFDLEYDGELNADHNAYWYNDPDGTFNIYGSENFEEWQALGFDVNSVIADPLFYDNATDLRICNEELADIGTVIPEVAMDYWADERDDSPTPGYYEYAPLTAYFLITETEGTIVTENLSASNATSWQWNFGDGISSDEFEPNHTYNAPGTYTVTLTVSNPCGVQSYEEQLVIESVGIDSSQKTELTIYPNPADNYLIVKGLDNVNGSIFILNLQRQIIKRFDFNNMKFPVLNIESLSPGLYIVNVIDQNKPLSHPIVVH